MVEENKKSYFDEKKIMTATETPVSKIRTTDDFKKDIPSHTIDDDEKSMVEENKKSYFDEKKTNTATERSASKKKLMDELKKDVSRMKERISMKKILLGSAIGLLTTACSPSQKEINEMIDQVPLNRRHSLVLDYDRQLLKNIDSLVSTGSSVADAVRECHDITWEEACSKMPKKSEWKGEEYVVKEEAQKQLEKSRETKYRTVMTPYTSRIGNTTTVRMRPVTHTYHTYKPEYRDSLAREIKNKENSKSNTLSDTLQFVKMQRENY
ncbi:MAG: hypothetical protein IKW39_01725 [Alphaproteobacteria bacterium]|nr:hypothetical protein [Alphaproteobacteria bacterium]